MAKVTITIEDHPNGKVKVVANPTFETMMKMHASGEQLTSAHAYALCAVNALRAESKNQEPTKILVPRIGRQ